ncbi:MAG: phosphomannomutase/phosphoglucomutase [Congregibacter sp.]
MDLVRRVSNDEAAEPEAYAFEGQWMVSLAQIATHPDLPARSAVLLVTLPIEALRDWLIYPGEAPGLFVLEQLVFGNTGGARSQTIAQYGSAQGAAVQNADVENAPWRIAFTPADPLVSELTGNIRPDYDILGIVTLAAFAGFALVFVRGTKSLQSEANKIISGAEQRTALEIRIPQLLPLAQSFRKMSLRRARGGVGAPSADPQGSAATSAPVTAIDGPSEVPLPASIFRAYDIRGIANEELDDDTVYRIACAIGTMAGELGEQTLVLGYDGRTSSRRIKAVVEKALLQAGRDVIDLGLIPTPLMYFATTQLDAKSGVMITGSHSPAEYNGMKIVLAGRTIAEGTIDRIRELAEQGRFSKGAGRSIQQDISTDYFDEVVSDIAIAVPLKIVVDAGNGATGHVAPALLEELGCDVVPLYCEVDGEFPNHSPDTSNEENLQDLIKEVLANDADFGVAFDGDGDRIAVVTGTGRIIRTDTLMMLFARDVVSRNPGADVVYDVKCSRNLAQLITSLGGRPVLWKTGHALMKQKMQETGALLGGEFSGHVFFGERWYGFDDAMYAAGRLAEILSSQELGLDDFIADLPNDVSTPEILVPVSEEKKFPLIEQFVKQARFKDGKTNTLDGLRVDFQDGWGLLRASNTGPALTARFEAKDEATLNMIQGLFRNQLASVAPDLDIPF